MKEMTAQEVFDTAVAGVIKQGGPAVINGNCKYRTSFGRKCAVGHLLTDDIYLSSMEGRPIGSLLYIYSELKFLSQHAELLESLQKAHDYMLYDYELGSFKEKARQIAKQYSLKTTVLD